MADAIRVAAVDIYPLFRQGLVQAFRRVKNVTVVAVGATSAEAEQFVAELKIDILLIEAAVPGSLKTARDILRVRPDVKIVFLSAAEDCDHANQAMQAGAHGYITKNISGRELVEVVKSIHAGRNFISPDLAARLLSLPSGGPSLMLGKSVRSPALSVREQQVLDQVSRGLTTTEIAMKLGLSISTIQNYKTLLFKKLGVRNRLEAMAAILSLREDFRSS